MVVMFTIMSFTGVLPVHRFFEGVIRMMVVTAVVTMGIVRRRIMMVMVTFIMIFCTVLMAMTAITTAVVPLVELLVQAIPTFTFTQVIT